jgi:hypothetical protein
MVTASLLEQREFELEVPNLEQTDDSRMFKTITKGCRHEVSETALGVRIHSPSEQSLRTSGKLAGEILG